MINYFLNKAHIIPVDFDKGWWQLLWKQRWYLIVILSAEGLMNVFNTLLPSLFGIVLSAQRTDYVIYLFSVWCIISLIAFIGRQCNGIMGQQCIKSIQINAHLQLLKVDPIFHTRKESGTIINKIDSGSRAYDLFVDEFSHDIIPVITGLITAVATIAHYNRCLSITLFGFIAVMALINVLSTLLLITPLEKNVIKREAEFYNVSLENLLQAQLIRASFASNEVSQKLEDRGANAMREECKQWLSSQLLYTIVKYIYIGSVLVLFIAIINMISQGTMTPTGGTALLLTYLRGTSDIIKLERPLRKTSKAYLRVYDLFSFIRNYGKQTFPVLSISDTEYKLPVEHKTEMSISARNLFFDYNPSAKIFDNHSFELTLPTTQENKLYGIIGPSGVGKSTFLHILGGQLRPASGDIFINDINIYTVDDLVRKKLIALQGQIASSLRGTLKYNLLFGIPTSEVSYTDEELIDILHAVGLWEIFGHHEGLSTFIGEGGLTLSGGQRQRLNFANLYLRAHHYKPPIILIDEPTSSLDELSERAITEMIRKLAKRSIVLIIAHRLRTIEDAQAILDFSLLAQENALRLHSKEELLTLSAYYQQLIRGAASLED